MAQKKQTTTKKVNQTKNQPKKQVEEKSKFSGQIKAIIIMAVALFILAILLIPTANLGSAGLALKSFIFGLFGFCAYLLPVLLGYIAVMIAFEKRKGSTATVVFAVLFSLFLDSAFEIFGHNINGVGFFRYVADSYKIANTSFGGGAFGSILAYPFNYFLGNPLSNITIILLIVVALMILTGTTLQKIGVFAKKTGSLAANRAQQIHNDTKEWISQHKEEKEEREQQEIEQEEREKEENKPRFDIDVSLDGMPDHPAVLDDLYKEKGVKGNKKVKKPKIDIPVDEPIEEVKPVEKEAKPIAKKPESRKKANTEKKDYVFPPIELLSETKNANADLVEAELKTNCELLVNVLRSFGVEVRVTGYSRGPSVTRYEIQPAIGVRISKITGLADDIALQLRAESVRIAPIPNKSTLGIEVPNTNKATIGMRDIISSNEFKKSTSKLNVALGKSVTGSTAFCDIEKMPHLLVAGTTGSGKSVCLNSMIMSILYRATPDEVKFVIIDPKAVEFPVYNGIPHLLVPVVTDSRKAAGALGWAVVEMEKRYKLLSDYKVRNISGYNEICRRNPEMEKMPHIVIIIDEFADLMMVAGNEVESSVCRLAQKARAAGMHLVIATQRPSADVFTGLIKSNIPSRVSLSVASGTDSRIIIDMLGAEKLLGRGDMLYMPIGVQKPQRIQGCFISDDEVANIVDFIVAHSDENEYDQEVLCEIDRQTVEDNSKKGSADDSDFADYDARINEAIELVIELGRASTSLLQTKLKLGYARAARIMDQLEEKGVVGPHQGAKPREILITRQDWMQMQMSGNANSQVTKEPKQLSFDDTAEDFIEEIEVDDTPAEEEFEEFVEFESEQEDMHFIDEDQPSVDLEEDVVEEDFVDEFEDEFEDDFEDEEVFESDKVVETVVDESQDDEDDDDDDELDFIDDDFLGNI